MHVFPLSLSGAASKWWNDEIDGTITTWADLMEFFCKYYILSRTSLMVFGDEDGGPGYLDFISWLNLKFRNHRRMDGKIRLWEFWIKGGDDEVLNDEIISSDEEREESGNTNHLNNNAASLFKPYLDAQEKNNICTLRRVVINID
nr:hypothetical protein [Tanacetum cinerariifolium]